MGDIFLFAMENEDSYQLCEDLTKAGYKVVMHSNYRYLFECSKTGDYDLFLIDLTSKEQMGGLQVIQYIKTTERTNNIPIIMLNKDANPLACIKFLDAGADDYLPIPFEMPVLLSRIAAVLRRYRGDNSLKLGQLKFETIYHEIIKGNNVSIFRKKEFDILVYLLHHTGNIVTREELKVKFWPQATSYSRSLDMHIANIRKKICPEFGMQIETIKNVGYKLSFIK